METNWIEKRQSIRREAELMLQSLAPVADSAGPAEALLHEVLVHKVELEMQIEELRRSHAAMAEARGRYADLYDFGSVGYLTLDREGQIYEVSLSAAAMLGVNRAKLINARFGKFVSRENGDFWHGLLRKAIEQVEPEPREFILELIRADGTGFRAHIDCRRLQSTTAAPLLRLAVFDIGCIARTEKAMHDVA